MTQPPNWNSAALDSSASRRYGRRQHSEPFFVEAMLTTAIAFRPCVPQDDRDLPYSLFHEDLGIFEHTYRTKKPELSPLFPQRTHRGTAGISVIILCRRVIRNP
jgi:hypothetical protein